MRGDTASLCKPKSGRSPDSRLTYVEGEQRIMVFEKVREILSTQFDVEIDSITADTDLVEDLNADSLDLVDMLMSLEDEFNIGEVPDEMVESIRTVGQLVSYIEENM